MFGCLDLQSLDDFFTFLHINFKEYHQIYFKHHRVQWRIADIDWPSCLSHFEFDYYDTVYNESTFKKSVMGPFQSRMEFELLNTLVPCDDEYAFITRVMSIIGIKPGKNFNLISRCMV